MSDLLTRRDVIGCMAAAAGARVSHAQSIAARLPADTPPGIAAILADTLRQKPESLNTDWFGTLLVDGLLAWGPRGIPEALDFAKAWLAYHLRGGGVAPFSGPHSSRIVHAGAIAITTYCGHYGLAFPCYEMARQFDDARARQVCLDIGSIILHQAGRNGLGMVMHDDNADFAIPDACYFAVVPLMLAATLGGDRGWVYREQALYQLRTYIDTFLVKETGLARTILLKTGLGKTYWTRASGWLVWAITGVLRHLSPQDPEFGRLIHDLEILARGVARVQHAAGGLHLFLDEPDSPLESSGTAMYALGVHESIRRGWLPRSLQGGADRAWEFVRSNFAPDGNLRHVYTGWALPAEQRKVEMERMRMGWIPGFALRVANEFAQTGTALARESKERP